MRMHTFKDRELYDALNRVKSSAEDVLRGGMGEDTKVLTTRALGEVHDALFTLAVKIDELQQKKES